MVTDLHPGARSAPLRGAPEIAFFGQRAHPSGQTRVTALTLERSV
jgi:hypothetical protein